MPFVISAGSFVSGMTGVQSVSVALTPQIQRLYQLGSNVPFNKNVINQHQLNITKYAGGFSMSVAASASCADANSISISVTAGGCAGGGGGHSDTWFPTSYSYNKDVQGWGMETWGFISRPTIEGGGATAIMIRGVAEGQSSTDGGASTGVSFIGSTVAGSSLEVTAGSPGIGRAFSMIFGEVGSIGGGTGKADGRDGTGSASVPYTPIYLA